MLKIFQEKEIKLDLLNLFLNNESMFWQHDLKNIANLPNGEYALIKNLKGEFKLFDLEGLNYVKYIKDEEDEK